MSWQPTHLRATEADGLVTPRPAIADGVAVLVFRVSDAWAAVEDRCSHAGCAFSTDGEVDGDRIICDCHGSEFDALTGAVVRGPAVRPIRTFPVRTVDGALEVDL